MCIRDSLSSVLPGRSKFLEQQANPNTPPQLLSRYPTPTSIPAATEDKKIQPKKDKTLDNTQNISNQVNPQTPAAPGFERVPFNQADFDKLKQTPETAQQRMDAWNQLVGTNEGLAGLKSRLETMESKAKSEEEKAPWMALVRAGLGMAAGKSQYALQNVAEGATAGLKDYADAKARLESAEDKRFNLQSQLAQAERSEKLAAAKYGIDSAEHMKEQNRATDLAALSAKSAADVANAKNALDFQQNAITAGHYKDWRDVMMDANRKSIESLNKAEKQQQTALLSAGLRDIDSQLKDPSIMLDKNRMSQLMAERNAVNKRLYELTGVNYTPAALPGAGSLIKPKSGGIWDYIPGGK